MSHWNPELYLQFEKERTQPVIDLISRIEIENPPRIIDIGCGPGNSTRELKKRWSNAELIGLDNSESMLKKARTDYPHLDFQMGDASKDLSHLGEFEVVFSNAVIQWIIDQPTTLKNLFKLLKKNGVLAIQVPNSAEMPINIAVKTTTNKNQWETHFKGFQPPLFYHDLHYYYDIISTLTDQLHLWETHYIHIMESHTQIVDWYKSTGMKPYLEILPNEKLRDEFCNDVLEEVRCGYKKQEDGKILFPFTRLFFLVYK